MEQDDNYVQKTVKWWWQEFSRSWDGSLYMWLREASKHKPDDINVAIAVSFNTHKTWCGTTIERQCFNITSVLSLKKGPKNSQCSILTRCF